MAGDEASGPDGRDGPSPTTDRDAQPTIASVTCLIWRRTRGKSDDRSSPRPPRGRTARQDAYQSFPQNAARMLYRPTDSCSNYPQGRAQHRPVPGRDRHETRHRHCGNHEARGNRDSLRLSGQSPHRTRRQRRHPPGDGAAGAHRPAHGGRDLAGHLRAHHRRVLHAARPRRGKRHGRRGAMLRRIRAGAGAADGLCAAARQYRTELQFQPGDEGVCKIVRADQPRRRGRQHLPPRLHQTEKRPRRAGDRGNPGRHVERGSAGAAELHPGAAHPLRRRPRACEGSGGAVDRRQTAGDLCRPGRALRARPGRS